LTPLIVISAYSTGNQTLGFVIELILGLNPLTTSGAIIVKSFFRGKIALWTGDPYDNGTFSINGCRAYMISSSICILVYPVLIYLYETSVSETGNAV
jgi:hypothetical protein